MEHKLDEFAEKLKSAGKDNLKAVVLYGSAVTKEFHAKHSDLNTLCVVERSDAGSLEAFHPAVEWWIRQGNRAPLIFTLDELRQSADIFAIELLDMKAQHRMLLGEDFFPTLSVPLTYHAIQVKRELRTDWLRLRQALLVAPNKKKACLELMVASFSAFATLFRHVLIVLGEVPAVSKREAIGRVAQCARSDPSGFYAVLDFREGKRKEQDIDIEKALNEYFNLVEGVVNELDRRQGPGD